MKNKKGITLVSLVITIVVMLIIAAITIRFVLANDGVVEKAEETRIDDRFSIIADEVYDREATIPTAFAFGELAEDATSFINRMKERDLIKEDDVYDDTSRTLYIGKKSDGSFKYQIFLADETKKD